MPPKLEPSSADETLSTAAIPSSALTLIPDLESAADDKVIESATLTDDEVARLGDLEKHIRDATLTIQAGYQTIAKALFQIKKERLYRESGSFETYVRDKFGYERSHGNRIADSGQILETSPQGDIFRKFELY